MYVCMYVCRPTNHPYWKKPRKQHLLQTQKREIRIYVCMYVCVYVYIRCIYVCVCVYIYIYIYIRVNILSHNLYFLRYTMPRHTHIHTHWKKLLKQRSRHMQEHAICMYCGLHNNWDWSNGFNWFLYEITARKSLKTSQLFWNRQCGWFFCCKYFSTYVRLYVYIRVYIHVYTHTHTQRHKIITRI